MKPYKILKFTILLLANLLLSTSLKSQDKEQEDKAQEKVEAAAKVLTEFKEMQENIPKKLLELRRELL